MKFLVENLNGSSFELEVDYRDTLLVVKQKIERSQRIHVSKQTLIVDGIVILREDLTVEQCQIVPTSDIQLEVSSDDDNPNHNDCDQKPQTEQSPAVPLVSAEEYFEGQDWPLTAEELRQIYSYRPEHEEKQYQKANHVLAGVKSKLRLLGPQEAGFVLLSQVHTSGAIEDQPSEALEVDFEDEYFGGLTPSYDTLEHVTGTSDSANQVVESSQGWCIKHEEKKIGIATGN
ncbi:Ubiquitin-like domain superfamily [Arabidopsis thaliana x Arabidopsis arenosa]|uniref:Ubiquitin-like domain superfamily n=1 Tax=Arabidopsis thaliana x Arabidopsis arenosa TaxID=1240361 RepID=A0A8T2DW58_9BRAS|nr:Ubiquitin-like domain superfamily [Arabidopsis thaliana x Arabidopsis arenosa]